MATVEVRGFPVKVVLFLLDAFLVALNIGTLLANLPFELPSILLDLVLGFQDNAFLDILGVRFGGFFQPKCFLF